MVVPIIISMKESNYFFNDIGNAIKSSLSGQEYSEARMRKIGERLLEVIGNVVKEVHGPKVDNDVAASLIFLFSGLLHLWRSDGKLGGISLRAGDSPKPKVPGVLEAGDNHLASEGINRGVVPDDASRAGKHHTSTNTSHDVLSQRRKGLSEELSKDDLEEGKGDQENKLKEVEVPPPPSFLSSFPLIPRLADMIMSSDLGLLKWGDSIRLSLS